MTDRNTISQVIESLFEDWIDKNINVHPLAVENMRILEADALAMLKAYNELMKEQEAKNVVNMTLSKDCFLIASCPKCNALLTRVEHKNYCGYCGQAVKWE